MRHRLHLAAATAAAALALVAALAAATAVAVRQIRRHRSPQRKVTCLRAALLRSLETTAADARWSHGRGVVVLSGGLDSAIVAEAGAATLGLAAAVTCICTDEEATDRPYAASSAEASGLKHIVVERSLRELLDTELATCVRVLRTFDPMTLRNEVAVCAALRAATAHGYTCAVTGDAADELLGGYSFTHGMTSQAWMRNRASMAASMEFGSGSVGAYLGLWVAQPYRDKGFVQAAKRFGKEECVATAEQAAAAAQVANANPAVELPAGRCMGKMPLRKAFPEVTSCWRRKDPIEVGCGTTALSRPGWFNGLITDAEFASEVATVQERYRVALRDKEHLFYYRAFRQVFPNGTIPGVERHGSDPCPACGYQMREQAGCFCHTCGHYDANMRQKTK